MSFVDNDRRSPMSVGRKPVIEDESAWFTYCMRPLSPANDLNARVRLLKTLHAMAAIAWIAGLGLFTALEGIAFGILMVVTALRWRATMQAVQDRTVRVPMLSLALLLGWMLMAMSWGVPGVDGRSPLPHRAFLGILGVLGASLSTRAILAAASVGGAWWLIAIPIAESGLVGHKAFHPGHPSLTYFGLMGLTASGIGALFGGPSVAMRSVGFVAVCAALLGTAHYGSRTCLVSGIFAVASSAIFTTTKHRFSWTIALCGALVAGTGIMAFFLSDAWDRTRIQYLQARQAGHDSIGDWAVSTYRSTSSSRDVLHAWTLDRVRQAPIVGHGARTWRAEFKASDSQSDHQLAGGAETWRSLRSNVSEAHSLYLEVLHDYGAIGLAMLLCLLVSLAVPPWMSRFGVRSVAAIAFLSSACAMGVYEGTLNSRPMIGFLAIILALAATGLSSGSRTERP